MAGLTNYQNVFRVAKTDAANSSASSRTAKRFRQPVSCLACRSRKLKCDRQSPCAACQRRGDDEACSYASSAPKRRDNGSRNVEAQARLQKLEEMVSGLLSKGALNSGQLLDVHDGHDAAIQELRQTNFDKRETSKDRGETINARPYVSPGHLNVNGVEANYVGATNWTAVLEDIRDIRGFLDSQEMGDALEAIDLGPPEEPDVLLDTMQHLTLIDVLESLPPRPECDRLLSVYFNAREIAMPILHTGKFSREYASFWKDPSSVSFLWISMLFSILHIGSMIARSARATHDMTHLMDILPPYLLRAGQALVTGKYQKALPYSCEALMLYALCKLFGKDDPDKDAWMLVGISVRLSMKMGYHRDPKYLPSVSPFEGEMRRRVFYIMAVFDLLISFQAGIPAIIHEEEIDIDNPKNLFDSDFDEFSKSIPPSRPNTDETPMLYHCYKVRLAKSFRRVSRHALSHKMPSYDEIMSLDKELRQVHDDIPPSLRTRPLHLSFTDQHATILHRVHVDLMYCKCLVVLHRAYLTHNRNDPSYDYSRTTCIDAALQILDHQAELDTASQPGGLFESTRWRPSALTQQEFLLAAMVISLELHESSKSSPDRQRKLYALRKSAEIWSARSAISREAQRAANVLAVMLSRVSDPLDFPTSSTSAATTLDSNVSADWGLIGAPALASNPESMKSSNSPETPVDSVDDLPPFLQPDLSDNSFNSFFEGYNDVDWGLVDQFLFTQNDKDDELPNQTMPPLVADVL